LDLDGPMIGTTLAHYEIRERLGRGGMGEVFRALDTRLGREVAVKLIPPEVASDPERIARFEREARALAALKHPNIATIHGFEEDASGSRFLVMELVEGDTLAERIARGPLPLDELLPIAIQIAGGLAAAHAKGIVHRDLKPANLMVALDGQVKILDFGLATAAAAAAPTGADGDATATLAPPLTEIGAAVGTFAYMSPEQALGRPVDARSDLFSLGAVLHEMATGRRAFTGPTPAAVLDSLLRGEPATLESGATPMPAVLAPVARRLLQRNLGHRHTSAAELKAELETIASGSQPSPRQPFGSVAVLPFANLSADPENQYFADGMADEIISALCKVEALRVASRTSAFAYRDRGEHRRRSRVLPRLGLLLRPRQPGARARVGAQGARDLAPRQRDALQRGVQLHPRGPDRGGARAARAGGRRGMGQPGLAGARPGHGPDPGPPAIPGSPGSDGRPSDRVTTAPLAAPLTRAMPARVVLPHSITGIGSSGRHQRLRRASSPSRYSSGRAPARPGFTSRPVFSWTQRSTMVSGRSTE
jgi:serine/threonine protein kinase